MTELVNEVEAELGPIDETVPEPVWNPLQSSAPEVKPLRIAKDHGVDMSITLKKWTGRERLTYEDAMTSRFLVETSGVDDDGDTNRAMLVGSLKAYGAALTVIASQGFPPAEDGRPFLTGTHENRIADLRSIVDGDLFDEIIELALDFQPLPGSGEEARRRAAAKKAAGTDTPAGGPDPSRTPSEQAETTATANTGTSVSPTE